jgi:Na+/H+ antiporter NhaD/arsenite permease-like protein
VNERLGAFAFRKLSAFPFRVPVTLVIAMASTLAGNFTVLGSIANLIVIQRASASGVAISFWGTSGSVHSSRLSR